MNNERRTFWPLLAAMMLLLTATLILTLKLERQPSMQRPVSDITYQQHWELDDVLQEVLNLMRAGRFTSAQSLLMVSSARLCVSGFCVPSSRSLRFLAPTSRYS